MSNDYLDFELDLGPLANEDSFPLTLLQSPAVDTSVDPLTVNAKLLFNSADIENQILRFRNALLTARYNSRSALLPHESFIRSFGIALYDVIFKESILREFQQAKKNAIDDDKLIRLHLRIRDPLLALLPWEYLYDEVLDDYLCLSGIVSLVRTLELSTHQRFPRVASPIRILGLASSPEDQPSLNIKIEKENLETSLKLLIDSGLVELQWLTNATWREFLEAKRSQSSWDVFHFIGHGMFNEETDEGGLLFVDAEGNSDFRSAKQLVRLLSPHNFSLVTLSACFGAFAGQNDIFSSVAASLLRRGVSSVLAMQYEISDEAAIEFSHQFYRSIADGLSLDAAIQRARINVDQAFTNLDWGLPAFYSRSNYYPLLKLPEDFPIAIPIEQERELLAISDGIRWPVVIPQIPDRITPSHRQWLEQSGFSHNPFSFQGFNSDTEQLFYELNLPYFDDIADVDTSTYIYSEYREDYRMASTGFLEAILNHQVYSYSSNELGKIFPIPVAFSLEDVIRKNQVLDLVAQHIAEWWKELLRLNPQLYLELDEDSQIDLMEVFMWYFKSIDEATGIFKKPSEPDAEMLIEKCRVQMRSCGQNIGTPRLTASRVRRWLNIRPPNRDYTFLLMSFAQDGVRILPQESILSDTLTSLESKQVRIKAFISHQIRGLFVGFADVELRWSEQSLYDEITRRFQKTFNSQDASSINDTNFNALFKFIPEDEDYQERLVKIADGSLGRMLGIGNAIIRTHVRKRPNELSLTDEDWEAVVQINTLAPGENQVAADGRGVASGGNITGGIIITGDNNTITNLPDNQEP